MFTIGLIVVLVFLLIALERIGAGSAPEKTLEVIEADDDDTKKLHKLIGSRR